LHRKSHISTDKFQLEKADYDKLQDFLNINWDNTLDTTNTNIDEMWERSKSILIQDMNKFIPRGSNRFSKRKKNFQPFNTNLQQLIHKNTVSGKNGFQQGIKVYLKNIKNP